MDTAQQFVRNLGPMRLAVIATMMLGLIGFFIWITARLATPNFELLFADLDMGDSARIVTELESAGIPYELRNNGESVLVPADMVSRTRVMLAEHGTPLGGSIGYELFDTADTMGTTNFVQNVNLVRALEGELARSIRSIDAVKAARVHLVLPKREMFSRKREEPTASVLLQMQGVDRLTPRQVLAIQRLVASGVPGLAPAKVSIVDGHGTLLTSDIDDSDGVASASARADERRREYENRLARIIEGLVEKTVGPGRVRAEVSAEMDFDLVNTSEEIFDPDGQVVRSTQAIEEAGTSREASENLPVSVGTNLPEADLGLPTSDGAAASESRTEETVNYEISKKVVNHVRESGVVKRLSVAVLVDGNYQADAEGAPAYQPRPDEELEQMATLIRGAIGFDAGRGDQVEVINMRFADLEIAAEEGLDLMFGFEKGDLLALAQYLVLIIFALLVILLVVRPLASRALEAIPVPAGGHAAGLLTGRRQPPALAAPRQAGEYAADGSLPVEAEDDEMISIDRIEGRVRASSAKRVGEVIEKHPEEALSIVRSWLHEQA